MFFSITVSENEVLEVR